MSDKQNYEDSEGKIDYKLIKSHSVKGSKSRQQINKFYLILILSVIILFSIILIAQQNTINTLDERITEQQNTINTLDERITELRNRFR